MPISTLVLSNVMNFSGELLLLFLPFFVCLIFLGCLGYIFFGLFSFGLSWQRRLCQRLLMPATAKCFSIYFISSSKKKNNLLAPSVLAFYGALWPPTPCSLQLFWPARIGDLIDVATILQHNFRLPLKLARIACVQE